MQGTWFDSCVGKIPWKRVWQPTPLFLLEESPWAEEPGGLQSMELQRVRYDWSDWVRTQGNLIVKDELDYEDYEHDTLQIWQEVMRCHMRVTCKNKSTRRNMLKLSTQKIPWFIQCLGERGETQEVVSLCGRNGTIRRKQEAEVRIGWGG